MKTIILAGGLGTRLSEETVLKPKPMVNIGKYPILWHIMKIYSSFEYNEFVPALGYKGEIIKNYFYNYKNLLCDSTIDLKNGKVIDHDNQPVEEWIVHLIDTGKDTQTGGRIKRGMEFARNERVMATYGDGLADVNIKELVKFHKSHGKLATLTAVRPPSRFGDLELNENNNVVDFKEKYQVGKGWINGGFFVLDPEVKDFIDSDDTPFERSPLETLSKEGQLMAYKHDGFWQPMDVIREKELLETLWESGKAPWKVW